MFRLCCYNHRIIATKWTELTEILSQDKFTYFGFTQKILDI